MLKSRLYKLELQKRKEKDINIIVTNKDRVLIASDTLGLPIAAMCTRIK